MLCRALRGSFTRKSLLFAGFLLLTAPACSVSFSASTPSGGDSQVVLDSDGGSAGGDDSSSADSGTAAEGGALPYQGSPLCNWSNAQSACDPDLPTTLASCKPSVSDAGAPSFDAGVQAYRCYVSVTTDVNMSKVTSQDCQLAGTGRDGAACQTGADCAAGFECVGAGVCRHYCCDVHECEKMGKLTFCDVQTETQNTDTRVPVCMPVRTCKLLLPGYCDHGETCAPVRSDGTTSCVAVGPAKAGESCERDHCAEGLACLGAPGNRVCYQLCHTDSTTECPAPKKCKTSSAQFADPTIGVCQ